MPSSDPLWRVQPVVPRGDDGAVAVLCAIIVVLVLVIVAARRPRTPKKLEAALGREGWCVYLKEGCTFCHKQMALLPGFRRFVLCSRGAAIGGYTRTPPLSCASVPAFPLWYNERTGEKRVGYQSAAALREMVFRT